MANLTSTDAVIVELYDNPLTERSNDRYGRVVNIASVTEDALIARAIAGGFNGNAESMKAAYNATKQEALKAIVRGEIVHFGLGHVVLDVEGAFEGDVAAWDPEKHKLVASITTSKEVRDMLKTTPVNVRGMAPDQAAIIQVTDVTTGKANEILTPNGIAVVRGSRIRIDGDKPGIGLFLTNQDTQQVVQIPTTAIGMNDPSRVLFLVSADLPAGSYMMSIVTQVAGNTTRLLNEPRTITFLQILTVK
jgi:hypothetical protein